MNKRIWMIKLMDGNFRWLYRDRNHVTLDEDIYSDRMGLSLMTCNNAMLDMNMTPTTKSNLFKAGMELYSYGGLYRNILINDNGRRPVLLYNLDKVRRDNLV